MVVAVIVTRAAIVMPTIVMMVTMTAIIVTRWWRMRVPAVISPFIMLFPPAMVAPVSAIPIAPAIILIANL